MIGIKKIDINVNLNVTEDLIKINHCLTNLIPDKYIFKNITITEVSGIFGNPIKTINLQVRDNTIISQFLNTLGEKLNLDDKKKIYREFSKRLGKKKNLHLRLKKSFLYNNEFFLYDHSDVIRITLYFINLETKSPKDIDPMDLREYLIISNIILKD